MLTNKQKQIIMVIHDQEGYKCGEKNWSDPAYAYLVEGRDKATHQDIIDYQSTDEYMIAFSEYSKKHKLAIKIIKSSIPKDIDAVWTCNTLDYYRNRPYMTTEYVIVRFSLIQDKHTEYDRKEFDFAYPLNVQSSDLKETWEFLRQQHLLAMLVPDNVVRAVDHECRRASLPLGKLRAKFNTKENK